MKVGYHCSHEQFTPGDLLAFAQRAEAAGFDAAMCSDHIAPFSEHQGESGFAWSWLGAALATTSLSFGTVNAPGQRYHPAVIAQAIATLGSMFPGRFWVALGSGEFINEHITGGEWPTKDRRNQRLRESAEVIRRLFRGEMVTCRGEITVSEARLYTLPETPPPLFGAAITPETARWLGPWADGLITVYQPGGGMKEVVRAFREGGGEGKPVYLQAQHAFGTSDDEALDAAFREWRHSILSNSLIADLRMPAQLDDASQLARPEDVAERVRISADPKQHLRWLQEYEALGFDAVYVHNVTREQELFIDAFGRDVLPHLARS